MPLLGFIYRSHSVKCLCPEEQFSLVGSVNRSGGSDKAVRVFRSASPLGRAVSPRLGKCSAHAFSVEIRAVHGSAGLLLPGIIEPAGINSIESEFLDALQHDRLCSVIVASDWQGDTTRSACRASLCE